MVVTELGFGAVVGGWVGGVLSGPFAPAGVAAGSFAGDWLGGEVGKLIWPDSDYLLIRRELTTPIHVVHGTDVDQYRQIKLHEFDQAGLEFIREPGPSNIAEQVARYQMVLRERMTYLDNLQNNIVVRDKDWIPGVN